MLKELEVRLTEDRFKKPLVVIESSLGNGREMYPDQLRALAAALCVAADEADGLVLSKKHSTNIKRDYTLAV
jgi:hypothetical protein